MRSRSKITPWTCVAKEDSVYRESYLPHARLVFEGHFNATEQNHFLSLSEFHAIWRFLTMRLSKENLKYWGEHLTHPVSVAPVD